MNLAKIQVSGVRAVAVDATREIPAGIVGATVELEYTGGIWAGLNKTVIFRGNTTKEVLTDETTVTVPAEVVAEPRGRLRVGVYGTDAANNLIMPTLWAELGVIADSAEPSEPADSALPIWAQLYAMIGNLGNLATAAKSSLVAAVNELVGKSGSADPEEIKKIVEDYLKENMPEVDLTGVVRSVNGQTPDENGNVEITIPESSGGGLTDTASELLITILRNGLYSTDQSANITALAAELGVTEEEEPDEPVVPDEPDKTLTSISAVYSGGDVAVGTAVSELTGIVVTAHYSDGASETVTGYNLSGTIAEGSNTITVSYGGMTTAFTVTGVAESGGDAGETVDTSPIIAQYGYGLTNTGTTAQDEELCYTDYYAIPDGYTGKVSGLFPNTNATYKATSTQCQIYQDDAFKTYWACSSLMGDIGAADKTMGLYYASSWPANKARFVLVTAYVDDSYLYFTDTGDIIFAGKNTKYYGMANINGTKA